MGGVHGGPVLEPGDGGRGRAVGGAVQGDGVAVEGDGVGGGHGEHRGRRGGGGWRREV